MFNNKIAMAQIDPNGLCNSKCWFCPVSYAANPDIGKKNMPIELLEAIIVQLVEGRGDFVSDTFDFVYTAHYNEVLLYKYFKEMLDIFRKYNIKTYILSNGTPLTKDKIDIISEYQDVVYGICLNIPSSDKERWASLVGMNKGLFDKMIDNINYAIEKMPEMFASNRLSIQVNGVNEASMFDNGGWLDLLNNAPELDINSESGDLALEISGFKSLFPGMNVYAQPYLVDRAGQLDKHNVISNIRAINRSSEGGKKVVGCANGREVGGRTEGWIHINANGDMFICCNDYDFETIYGNITEDTIKNIWQSKAHADMIDNSYKSFCTTCSAAIWG